MTTPSQYLHPLAQEFYFESAQPHAEACLVMHGFTGSPAHMRPLGEVLHRAGYTVHGVRLAGHGTHWQEMEQTRWPDWLHSARVALRDAQQKHRHIHVMGLSMGGLISLILAQEFPVASVTTIASPLRLPNRTPYFTDVLKYAVRYKEWEDEPALPGTAEEYMVHYAGTPLATGSSLIKLMRLAEAGLSHITAPCLVIQSKADETVDPVSAEIIHQGVSSKQKKLIWLEISRHVSTLGPERDVIHQAIPQFLKDAVSAESPQEVHS